MSIEILEHARKRMSKYNVTEQTVLDALKDPNSIAKGHLNRKIAQKRLNTYVLRVVYEEASGNKKVITVYKARSERYEI